MGFVAFILCSHSDTSAHIHTHSWILYSHDAFTHSVAHFFFKEKCWIKLSNENRNELMVNTHTHSLTPHIRSHTRFLSLEEKKNNSVRAHTLMWSSFCMFSRSIRYSNPCWCKLIGRNPKIWKWFHLIFLLGIFIGHNMSHQK